MRPRTRNPIRKRRKSRNTIEDEEPLFDDVEAPDLGHDKPPDVVAAPVIKRRRKRKPAVDAPAAAP